MKNRISALMAISVFALVAACGGGGGGGGDGGAPEGTPSDQTASTLSFPVETVIAAVATSGASYTVSNGADVLTVSYAAGPQVYDRYIYSSALPTFFQTETLKTSGAVTDTSSTQVFYSSDPFLVWGSVNGDAGENTMQVKQQALLPATAKVGAAGPMYAGKNYLNNSSLFPDDQSVTWSLEADTATTAWLCIHITNAAALFPELATVESDCFRIDPQGVVSGFKVDMTVPDNCDAYTCGRTTIRYR